MKKSQIAGTVFAVIVSTVSLTWAEGFGVDFDRGSLRTLDFMEAVKTSNTSKMDNTVNISPVLATAGNPVETTAHRLSASELQKLREEALTMPDLSKEFLLMINNEKTIVLHNDTGIFLTNQVGINDYYMLFESNDKKLINFLLGQKTGTLQAGLQNKNKVKVCKAVIKTLWKWIKEAWVAYEITEEICSWEDDGETSSTTNGGGGGNGGQSLHPLPINPPVRRQILDWSAASSGRNI